MKEKVIRVKRETSESQVIVSLDFNKIRPGYRKAIKTPIAFLNHMIEHIAWRAQINIAIDVQLDEFTLHHLICEDVGQTLGRAVLEHINNNLDEGIKGFGDGIGIIDEAMSRSVISFESRTYFEANYDLVTMPSQTEGMLSEDLETFLEGFAQGANCTLHIDVLKGRNGHHIWEAIYRSFGTALNRVLEIDQYRKDMTSGVAGKIKFEVEKS